MYDFKEQDLNLYYRSIPVGLIKDAFESDYTWHGIFEHLAEAIEPTLYVRIRQFICFSIDWHERIDAPETSADEWDAYRDIAGCGWYTKDASGVEAQIDQAPVFFPGGDITWAFTLAATPVE